MHRAGWLVSIGVLAFALPSRVRAQSVNDVVREHVKNGLEGQPDDKPKPPAEKPASAPKPKPKPDPKTELEHDEPVPAGGWSFSTDAPDVPEAPSTGPKLPIRILGEKLKIDLVVGGGYRGWVPQQYPTVKVDAGSYWVWTIDVKAKIFRFLNLHRGYYESNGLAGPRTDSAAVASRVGSYVPKAAWLLGVLGFPLFKVWEPILRYESRAFHTAAHPKQPVCVVTEAVANDLSTCTKSTNQLDMISGFETFVAGVKYDKSKEASPVITERKAKVPPITFGIGLMQYQKPYQVTVGKSVLQDYLFDGRFRGAGLYLGTQLGGGPDKFFVEANAQFGLGQVELLKSLTLNSLAPEDWLIGYVQGNASVGYYLPIIRTGPTLMFVPTATGGGASFFFFKANQKAGQKSDSQSVNWDFLWSLHAALVLAL